MEQRRRESVIYQIPPQNPSLMIVLRKDLTKALRKGKPMPEATLQDHVARHHRFKKKIVKVTIIDVKSLLYLTLIMFSSVCNWH